MSQVIGITGGIASGKSMVTTYLRQKGYQVIDADELVHHMQSKGGLLYQRLVDEFGDSILTETGDLDRKYLAKRVFSDRYFLNKLSELQNSVIKDELLKKREQLLLTQDIIFMDIPLLFEQGYEAYCDQVWLVYVNRDQQLNRLMLRNQYSEEEAKSRIAAQLSFEEKKEKSDYIIDNSGSLEQSHQQIDNLLRGLC